MPVNSEELMEIMMVEDAYLKKVATFQEFFWKQLRHSVKKPAPAKTPDLIFHLLETDEEIVKFCLGKIGEQLKTFVNNVDLTHPELESVLDGVLCDGNEFAETCKELLLLGKFAKEHNLERTLPLFSKVATKLKLSKNISRRIDSPFSNKMHVRLIEDRKHRDTVRAVKRMQTIDLRAICRKGKEVWDSQPDSFLAFLRFSTVYEKELKRARKKAKRYADLGCKSLEYEIGKSIKTFEQQLSDNHYGFHRITMTNAAVILAKSLEFELMEKNQADENDGIKTIHQIIVPRSFFGLYNFDPNYHAVSPFVEKMRGISSFYYQPRVYPLHELWPFAPKKVIEMINHLEEFPEANGKAIFDHFGVIVPGIKLPGNDPKFLDEKGNLRSFGDVEVARRQLDLYLIENHYFHPVIVGEKDGKCYFLSYWS